MWDEAIDAYSAILEKTPALTVAQMQIASAYHRKGEYDQAIAAYRKVLQASESNDDARIAIGMLLLEVGDLAAAEKALLQAAGGNHPTREVFYNLGELKLAQGRLDEATAWYERARALDPDWDRPTIRLAVVANRHEKNANDVASTAPAGPPRRR
jgi:tetratricopeptide (TPR) repeat protein